MPVGRNSTQPRLCVFGLEPCKSCMETSQRMEDCTGMIHLNEEHYYGRCQKPVFCAAVLINAQILVAITMQHNLPAPLSQLSQAAPHKKKHLRHHHTNSYEKELSY